MQVDFSTKRGMFWLLIVMNTSVDRSNRKNLTMFFRFAGEVDSLCFERTNSNRTKTLRMFRAHCRIRGLSLDFREERLFCAKNPRLRDMKSNEPVGRNKKSRLEDSTEVSNSHLFALRPADLVQRT